VQAGQAISDGSRTGGEEGAADGFVTRFLLPVVIMGSSLALFAGGMAVLLLPAPVSAALWVLLGVNGSALALCLLADILIRSAQSARRFDARYDAAMAALDAAIAASGKSAAQASATE
jgi:hypothetical protein